MAFRYGDQSSYPILDDSERPTFQQRPTPNNAQPLSPTGYSNLPPPPVYHLPVQQPPVNSGGALQSGATSAGSGAPLSAPQPAVGGSQVSAGPQPVAGGPLSTPAVVKAAQAPAPAPVASQASQTSGLPAGWVESTKHPGWFTDGFSVRGPSGATVSGGDAYGSNAAMFPGTTRDQFAPQAPPQKKSFDTSTYNDTLAQKTQFNDAAQKADDGSFKSHQAAIAARQDLAQLRAAQNLHLLSQNAAWNAQNPGLYKQLVNEQAIANPYIQPMAKGGSVRMMSKAEADTLKKFGETSSPIARGYYQIMLRVHQKDMKG